MHSTEQQQHYYHGKAPPNLKEGQKVLLDNPTKGKLDPCWTGPWVVLHCNDPTTVQLKMGSRKQTVHINQVCPLLEEDKDADASAQWSPPFSIMTMMRTIWNQPVRQLILRVFQLLGVAVLSAQLTIMGTRPSLQLT